MRRYRNWVVTLGIMAVTPGIAVAGPLSFLKSKAAGEAQNAQAKPAAAPATPSNQQVAEGIAAALKAAQLNGYDIEIEYQAGVATLHGKITDARQKALASRVTSRVPGVKQVDNQLIPLDAVSAASEPSESLLGNVFGKSAATTADYIAPQRRSASPIRQVSGTQSAPAIQSNQQVAEKIAESLSTSQLSGYDIEVRFQDGQALLTGSVESEAQRAKATKVVSQVPGVRMVSNQLAVPDQNPSQTHPRPPVAAAAYQPPHPGAAPTMPGGPPPGVMPGVGAPPPGYGPPGRGVSNTVYDLPHMPEYAWPSYASYPNYAQVAYPKQYSASAWPYIGPFYPYPQVPLGWRKVALEWDDGYWNLTFDSKTDKWWWFVNPKNW